MSELNISSVIMRENMLISGEIYTTGKKIYTAAGSDGIDKYHLWANNVIIWREPPSPLSAIT